MIKRWYDYDDPYRILAHLIVGFYRPADVYRILNDDEYIKSMIVKEVRGQDLGGWFIDCTIADILAKKHRMEMMAHLDLLAGYFYEQLDKKRLRDEIRAVLDLIGVELDDYSAGKVSSAKQ